MVANRKNCMSYTVAIEETHWQTLRAVEQHNTNTWRAGAAVDRVGNVHC